ncbi:MULTISPECIES: amidohydrolase family protein [unclassified Pseudofrankia]|uniref:amidohydrolase family protein n=1 Tax=unclassified Pseudofrankia TaxID=2994372 RepID=UPI0012FFBDA2|nr:MULTISPECIES: amidohydrolase family protein [unclassified Pseudofrankia]MDT3439549.1 amidohydrolase family protein [Pseudofrankia sp. BMG5.37]
MSATRTGRWRLAGVIGDAGLPEARAGAGAEWELAVDDGVITTLRPAPAAGSSPPTALVLCPPLLNGHDHGRGPGTVDAGIPDAPLEEWLETLDRPVRPRGQDELVGLAAGAMLRAGVGAAVFCVNPTGPDVVGEVRAAARAAIARGIRAAVAFPVLDAGGDRRGRRRDAPGAGRAAVDALIEDVERLAGELTAEVTGSRAAGLVDVQLGPVGPQWVAEATLARLAEHSAATGRRLHLHLLESPGQRAWADDVYPDGLLPAMDRLGLLTERTTVAHGTQLRDDELALLGERGVTLALNASSNLRLAAGVAPVARAAARVRAACLGLDGLALSDDHDGWAELRLARGLWQAQAHRRVPGTAALALATSAGRAAFGAAAPRPPAEGRLADLVLLDLSPWRHLFGHPDWPLADIAVAAAGPAHVAEVWVAGTQVHHRPEPSSAPAPRPREVPA